MSAKAPVTEMKGYFNEADNTIELSVYDIDDPLYENNHVALKVEGFKEQRFAINPISNILFQAGVRLVMQS